MREEYTLETVDIKTLYRIMLEHLRSGYRLVQICATSVDGGAELIYSVALDYKLENYKIFVEEDEEINSISDIFPSAALFENEISELFGVKIDSINMDFHGKFYRIDKETPFKKNTLKEDVKVIKKAKEEEQNG